MKTLYAFFLSFILALPVFAQALQQGSVAVGQTVPGAQVFLDGEPVLVANDGRFVLGFDRDAKATWQLTTKLPDGREEQQTLAIAPRDYKIQRVDGVPSRTVGTPQSEDTKARIAREVKEIRQARSIYEPRILYDASGFTWPVEGRVTGVFGSQRVYNGTPGRPHYGIDIAAPTGSAVLAPAAGIVRLVQDDNFYSGGTILLDHGMGLVSAFLHLSGSSVTQGQFVQRGEKIGEVGSTGRSTGPHLDWRMNWGPDVRVDVGLLVPQR